MPYIKIVPSTSIACQLCPLDFRNLEKPTYNTNLIGFEQQSAFLSANALISASSTRLAQGDALPRTSDFMAWTDAWPDERMETRSAVHIRSEVFESLKILKGLKIPPYRTESHAPLRMYSCGVEGSKSLMRSYASSSPSFFKWWITYVAAPSVQ